MTGRREHWDVTHFSRVRRRFQPQCDCYRTDDPPALHLLIELPGVDPAAVGIVTRGTALVVSGVRERPHPYGARYRQVKIEYGAFERQIDRVILPRENEHDLATTNGHVRASTAAKIERPFTPTTERTQK